MNLPRTAHAAALLSNGQVLIVGGRVEIDPKYNLDAYDTKVFRFDAYFQGFRGTGARLQHRREHATATLLENGHVLVAGGDVDDLTTGTAELFSPGEPPRFLATQSMPWPLFFHRAVRLLNGDVLVVGGSHKNNTEPDACSAKAANYHPADQKWHAVESMHTARCGHGIVILPTGHVVVHGGRNNLGTILATAEIYDPSVERWYEIPVVSSYAREQHTLTAVISGKDIRLYAIGGRNGNNIISAIETLVIPTQ